MEQVDLGLAHSGQCDLVLVETSDVYDLRRPAGERTPVGRRLDQVGSDQSLEVSETDCVLHHRHVVAVLGHKVLVLFDSVSAMPFPRLRKNALLSLLRRRCKWDHQAREFVLRNLKHAFHSKYHASVLLN
jgi:hypothetical protein